MIPSEGFQSVGNEAHLTYGGFELIMLQTGLQYRFGAVKKHE